MNTSSVVGQLVDRMVAALLNVTDAADRVFDSREAAIARGDTPCIAITPPDSEDSKPFGDRVDENTALVTVEVLVRGDPWRKVADPIAVQINSVLMRDTQLRALVVDIRRHSRKWEAQEGDATAGSDAITYRVIYQTMSNDMANSI